MAAGDIVQKPDGTEVVLGEVGQQIVFENDRVRVWSIQLQPGESQPWHRHHYPYLVIAIQEAHNRIDPLSGGEPKLVHETVGGTVFREAGEIHMLTNRGETVYESRLVELLHLGEASDPEEILP
ncbi:hypothetical protein BH09ACT1_BH09ACT1_24760 [soil metagenome]